MSEHPPSGSHGASPDPATLRIARVLRARKRELLDRWMSRTLADAAIPHAAELQAPSLLDHLPLVVDDLIRHLEEHARAPNDPEERGRAGRTIGSSEEHGRHRAHSAYSITAAVRELSHLRVALIELCAEAGEPLTADAARIVHAALDEVIGSSVQAMENLAIGDLEHARAQAEGANAAKDSFLAVVSHELRTPLSSILGWAELMRRDEASATPPIARGLEVIDRSARTQLRLVEDLLDAERLRTGKLTLAMEVVDLRSVARAALDLARPVATQRHIELEADVAQGPIVVRGDADRLQQVISNLLANALKFTPSGGTVRVEVERAGDRARVTVSDTGRGIAPEELPTVFERFRQTGPAGSRGAGIGLGLALVHSLVLAHEGAVKAESAGAGKGATFTIELPAVEGDDPRLEPTAS